MKRLRTDPWSGLAWKRERGLPSLISSYRRTWRACAAGRGSSVQTVANVKCVDPPRKLRSPDSSTCTCSVGMWTWVAEMRQPP